MSWQIFVHSVRQVFGNLEGALRVSAVLTLVQIVIALTIGRAFVLDPTGLQARLAAGDMNWPGYLLTMVLLVFTSLWIAVGWHRYILTNERPSFVPKLYLDRVLGYFGKSILIGLIVVPVALVLGLIVGLALGPLLVGPAGGRSFLAMIVVGLLVYIPVGVIVMRLSTALPGVALQPGVPLMEGWNATTGQSATILGVVVLSVACIGLIGYVSFALFTNPMSIPALVWHFLTQWVMVMVSVSILTTLYGHYIEKRPLV
ncbi:MAG: hypothetical protein ACRC6I_06150 [Paracoccaceae bacterium]